MPSPSHRRSLTRGLAAVALATVVGLSVGSAPSASAHGDDGRMQLTALEQVGPRLVRVEAGVVYANDNDLAESASVSASFTGPEGATVGPVTMPKVRGSLYGVQTELPSSGAWKVAVRSTGPTALVDSAIEVRDQPTSPATSTPAPTTTAAAATPTTAAPTTASTPVASATGAATAASTATPLPWIALGIVVVLLALAGGWALSRRRTRT